MASYVDICNLALAHLGDEATVSSISPPDGSAQASHCARFYPIARNIALESHPWRFATFRAALALRADEPPTGWTYAYGLPNLCLRPLRVLSPESTDDNTGEEFKVESAEDGSQILYTKADEAILVFIKEVVSPGFFSPLFIEAYARLLASFLAGPVLKGATGMKVGEAQYKMYDAILNRAKVADAQTQKVEVIENNTPSSIAARA
ncbi:MAG: hypothetical protein IT456_10595 [Planctomycetes bacterium]|nr:hypothetical protein [Planctomycetota bacterium]